MRDLDSDLADEIIKTALSPIFLVEAFFPSGTLRFWTGYGQITYNDNIYIGSGTLLSISEITESQNVEANGVQFTLTGIPSELMSIFLLEKYHGKIINLYFACLTEAGALVGEPYKMFAGFMDQAEFQDAGETATIVLSAENRLIELKKSKTFWYTPMDQKRDFPSDKGLDFQPALQDKEIIWGKKS